MQKNYPKLTQTKSGNFLEEEEAQNDRPEGISRKDLLVALDKFTKINFSEIQSKLTKQEENPAHEERTNSQLQDLLIKAIEKIETGLEEVKSLIGLKKPGSPVNACSLATNSTKSQELIQEEKEKLVKIEKSNELSQDLKE